MNYYRIFGIFKSLFNKIKLKVEKIKLEKRKMNQTTTEITERESKQKKNENSFITKSPKLHKNLNKKKKEIRDLKIIKRSSSPNHVPVRTLLLDSNDEFQNGNLLSSTNSARINHNLNLNLIDTDGNSILHTACSHKSLEAALFILEKLPANHPLIDLKNHQGNTVLHLAFKNGMHEVTEELIHNKNADIFTKNLKGQTAVDFGIGDGDKLRCLRTVLARSVKTGDQNRILQILGGGSK